MDTPWGFYFPMFWIFPLFCLIFMVVMMFRRGGMGCMPFGGGGHRTDNRHETPRQILDRRYASGEVTKEQYEQMKLDLEGARNSPERP